MPHLGTTVTKKMKLKKNNINTPIRGLNKSPAELALGRELRDTILPTERYRVNPEWAYVLRERERTMVKENKLLKSKPCQN